MKKLIAAAVLILTSSLASWAASGSQTVANETGLAYSTTYYINLNQYGGSPQISASKLSAQVTVASVTFANGTFTDGRESTGTITVLRTNALNALNATNQITVPATSAILGTGATDQFNILASTGLGSGATAQITINSTTSITAATIIINGYGLMNGSNWATGITSSDTCHNLATAINNFTSLTNVVANCPGTGSVVYATATVNGAAGRLYTLTSTTGILSTTTFSGGTDSAYVTVNGNRMTNGVEWSAGNTSTDTAKSISDAINARIYGVTSSWNVNGTTVVFATCTAVGVSGNSFSLGSSKLTSVSTATTNFAGGKDPALYNQTITFNGDVQKNGYLWTDASGTSTGTAVSIAAWLSSYGVIRATATASVVYATATAAGLTANAYTLSASTTNLSVASATFSGGQDSATITLDGVTLTYGKDWTLGASSTTTTTALSIANAINANTTLNQVINSTNVAAVVKTTSTIVGTASNFTITSSTAALTVVGMSLGSNAGYTVGVGTITLAAHGFTKALPVLLSTGGATLGGLVNQTTYYVIVVDSNSIQLATTSSLAQGGTGVVFTSSSTGVSAHTVTLAPLAWSQGTASAKWEVSNDGINWTNYGTTAGNVAVSSQTFTAVYPSSTSVQDFGTIDYGYMRYNVIAPSQGAASLKVILNAKD